MKKRGFTLIELLVVISIISLLSSVLLASLGNARLKATNARKISLVKEYVKALELYQLDHNSYPVDDSVGMPNNFWVCLGINNAGNICDPDDSDYLNSLIVSNPPPPLAYTLPSPLANISQSGLINNALNSYFNGPPASLEKTTINGVANQPGLEYACVNYNAVTHKCAAYELVWWIQEKNSSCGAGTTLLDASDATWCAYP